MICIFSFLFLILKKKRKFAFIFLIIFPTFYYFNRALDIYVFTHSDMHERLFIIFEDFKNNNHKFTKNKNDYVIMTNNKYFMQINNFINLDLIDYNNFEIYLIKIVQSKKYFVVRSHNYCFAFDAYYEDYFMPQKISFRMIQESSCEDLKSTKIFKINGIFIFQKNILT